MAATTLIQLDGYQEIILKIMAFYNGRPLTRPYILEVMSIEYGVSPRLHGVYAIYDLMDAGLVSREYNEQSGLVLYRPVIEER